MLSANTALPDAGMVTVRTPVVTPNAPCWATVTPTAKSWLASTSERRLIRSASTPAGMVTNNTGIPSAKNTAPDQAGPLPSPPSSTA